jgi:catechol 2,3-dioxygenase-like lactoylglutathione lyase family enzyme
MEPRISFVTLGVHDFDRALRFYRDGLAWPISKASHGDVAFFRMGGLVLALYPWDKLAEDATVSAEGSGFRGMALAYNVRLRHEVAEALAIADAAGGRIVKPAQDTFWGGHAGYFADTEGYLWEVAWNPHFPFREDGSVILP